jgi:hypothetical protein
MKSTTMRKIQIALVVSASCIATATLACSPVKMTYQKPKPGAARILEPEFSQYDYAFVGEVVGEQKIVIKSSSGQKEITSLKVRVITSDTPKTAPGEILNFHQYEIGGPACEHWGGVSLSSSDVPIGARVRVITPRAAIFTHELHARFKRVD